MKADALKFLKSEHAALPRLTEKSLVEEGRKTNNYLFMGDDADALAEALDPKWEGPLPYSLATGRLLAGDLVALRSHQSDVCRRVLTRAHLL